MRSPSERFPDQIPCLTRRFFLNADPANSGPKLKAAITPIILDELVPEFVGKNRE